MKVHKRNQSHLVVLVPVLLWLSCSDKMPARQPALEDGTLYALTPVLTEVKRHLDAARQYQLTGRDLRAAQEFLAARNSIEKLESYYLPLLNSRAHVAASYRLMQQKQFFKAKEELVNARAQLAKVSAKAEDENVELISKISTEMQLVEKSLERRKTVPPETFNSIAVTLNKLTAFYQANLKEDLP